MDFAVDGVSFDKKASRGGGLRFLVSALMRLGCVFSITMTVIVLIVIVLQVSSAVLFAKRRALWYSATSREIHPIRGQDWSSAHECAQADALPSE